MKKTIIIFLLSIVGNTLIYAQNDLNEDYKLIKEESYDKYKVETNRFWSNWFIGAGGGAQMYFGDHNKQMNFKDRLTPEFEVLIGKWFSPGIGVRAMYNARRIKGATQNGAYTTGKIYDGSQWLSCQEFKYVHLHGDALFNLTNIFSGYKENRFYNVSPYIGVGMMFHEGHPRKEEISFTIGIFNGFMLSKSIDLTLDIMGTMVNDRFDGELGNRRQEGVLSIALGLSYKFKKRGWSKSYITTIYDKTEINGLRKILNDLNKENNQLKDELSNNKSLVKEKIISQMKVAPIYVNFKKNETNLSPVAKVNLSLFAEYIKKLSSNTIYVITGYADSATGDDIINEKLSKERAEVVYNCLVGEFNVPAGMLKVDHKGGVGNMFYDSAELSRAVITKSEE